VWYALWNACGWHRDYSPPAWRNRATEEQKREGWETAVRIEKISAAVLDEAHKRQAEESIETLAEGPDGFYELPRLIVVVFAASSRGENVVSGRFRALRRRTVQAPV
jgi:hypothetical protein